ncbi:MAG TPA: NAD(+) diphosphatase [Thermoanaerobaculia bacterium]|nr:NAD(+) diphosphatase [Thermoanaerobaculia bacterium]
MTFNRYSAERNEPIDATDGRMLVVDGEQFAVNGDRLVRVPYTGGEAIFLGREKGQSLVVIPSVERGTWAGGDTQRLPSHPGPSLDARDDKESASYTWLDFRSALAALSPEEVTILSYARGMLQWTARTRFCSVCGTALEVRRGGHMRFCPGCNMEHYPRLDPAVMMLVTHGDRLLLARHQGRGAKFWSTLAGFVEQGETLEQAAARELHEETGLIAASLRYFGSQPWPLPASLMIGFEIEAEDDVLTIDTEELAEARWFTRDELGEITTSSTISLSGQMIAAWRGR